MSDQAKTKEQLIAEVAELRRQLASLEGAEAERKQAEEELRTSEERYRLLTEAVSLPVWRCDASGALIECNRRWYEYTGQTPEEAAGNGWMKALHPDDVARTAQKVQDDVAGGEIYQAEYRLRRALDGAYRWHLARALPLRDANGTIVNWFGSGTDIHDQKQTQEELERRVEERTAELSVANEQLQREIEERKRAEAALAFLASFPEKNLQPVMEVGLAGDIRYANPAARRLLPELTEQGLSHPWMAHWEAVKFLFSEGRADTVRREVNIGDRWYQQWFYFFAQEQAVRIYGRDVTEQKQAQEALERERQSLWKMLQASDHERQLIAYDIHDGLAQYLAAAGMQFDAHGALKENCPEKARRAYETAVELVRQAHAEARRLINEVRPPVIDEIGIETAISHLVHEQRRRGGPEIELRTSVQFVRLSPTLENSIYRIVQEALNNACKHSKGNKVSVALTQKGEELWLKVRDRGVGFDPHSVEKGRFGLEGIRQRVRLLGGRLTIKSEQNSGTLIRVVLPILRHQTEG